jgi:4-hydroxybenzoate polyprenyltransferase/phosphoserine phosphatase
MRRIEPRPFAEAMSVDKIISDVAPAPAAGEDDPVSARQSGSAPPLVIDLDGTLIRTDLLHESTFGLLRGGPHLLLALPLWLARGKAHLKRRIAERVSLDVTSLPYDESVLEWIRAERTAGRRIVLCTASDQTYARKVAEHLGVFDELIASDGLINVSAHRKAALLVERFGIGGFDYAGDSLDDLPVWEQARHTILVNASVKVRAQARARFRVEREFERPRPGVLTWLRAMRLHQWLKNLLVFLPLGGAHQLFDTALLGEASLAFVAFGLCASSVYILNDLVDLESDRQHPRKRSRPFATGALSPLSGLALAVLLLAGALAIALPMAPAFMGWLGAYYGLTMAYTFFLKRRVLVDCLTLGALYTLRIVAGWAAVGLAASFWLLAFSLFLFLSLAFVKRYSELLILSKSGHADARGRGYQTADLSIVQTMGVASGFTAVMLMALYINGDTVLKLYSRPEILWLSIPVLLYWVSRMWMQAHRGNMQDDPLIFAVKDHYSLTCGALFVAALWAAT